MTAYNKSNKKPTKSQGVWVDYPYDPIPKGMLPLLHVSDLQPTAKAVMGYLLWQGYGFPHKNGIDSVGEVALSRILRIHPVSISKSVTELARRGWINKSPLGYRKQNSYHINPNIREWIVVDGMTVIEWYLNLQTNSPQTNSIATNSPQTNSAIVINEMTDGELVASTISLQAKPLLAYRLSHSKQVTVNKLVRSDNTKSIICAESTPDNDNSEATKALDEAIDETEKRKRGELK